MASEKLNNSKVWVDATLVLKGGIETATGIPRVEAGLCQYALKNHDIGLAYFDQSSDSYVVMDGYSKSYLNFLIEENASRRAATYVETVKKNLRYLIFQAQNGRVRATKRISVAFAGNTRVAKYVYPFIYIVIYVLLLMLSITKLTRKNTFSKSLSTKSIMLTSFSVKQNKKLDAALAKFGAIEAHIFYDIIPILHPDFLNEKLGRAVVAWMSRALKRNTPIVTISETVAAEVLAWNERDVKADRTLPIKACKLTVPFDVGSGDVEAVAQLNGKNFVMFVSSIDVRKGQVHLVKVWKSLATRFDEALLPDLVLIGRKGNGWKALESELQGLGSLAEKIHVLCDVGDAQLRWCYKHTSFSLFPSVAEGWGLGVSESMAYHVPVLHSDIPVFHEVSQGLMPSAPAHDVEAWAAKIAGFIQNPNELARLRQEIKNGYVSGQPDDFARCALAYFQLLHMEMTKSTVGSALPTA